MTQKPLSPPTDLQIEAMCIAAWEIKREWVKRDGVSLPPWGQVDAPACDPFDFCDVTVFEQMRAEMVAARNAFFDCVKAQKRD